MNIGNHHIGVDQPYIIAEIGSNHGGSLAEARRLIWLAADAQANAAKFQYFDAHELYPGSNTPGAVPTHWLQHLKNECATTGIDFICSIFSEQTLRRYLDIDPVAIKIAAPEATNHDLVTAAAETGLPLLISTGAMTWNDLDDLPMLHDDTALLHCVSSYPAPPDEMNLQALIRMAGEYGVQVGLSDHTLNPFAAPIAAVALGATIIEKHFTPDRTQPGPDHSFATQPEDFRLMCEAVRTAWTMLGDGNKRVMPSEDATDRRAA